MAMPDAMPMAMRTATRPPVETDAETGIKRVNAEAVPTPAPYSTRGLLSFELICDFLI